MIGYIASVLVTIAYLPQLFEVVKKKHARGMSTALLVILKMAMCCWILHGLKINDYPLILSSALSLIQISIISFYKYKDL